MEEYMKTMEESPQGTEGQCNPQRFYCISRPYGQVELSTPWLSTDMCFVASHFQQLTGDLRISDLKAAKAAFNEFRPLSVKLLYRVPNEPFAAKYLAFSNASQGEQSYFQAGYISGILIQQDEELI